MSSIAKDYPIPTQYEIDCVIEKNKWEPLINPGLIIMYGKDPTKEELHEWNILYNNYSVYKCRKCKKDAMCRYRERLCLSCGGTRYKIQVPDFVRKSGTRYTIQVPDFDMKDEEFHNTIQVPDFVMKDEEFPPLSGHK